MNRLAAWYGDIFRYFRKNWRWVLIAILVVAEILVYTCMNTAPNCHYEQYVAETLPTYSGMFWFVLIENLKSAVLLVALGFVPFG